MKLLISSIVLISALVGTPAVASQLYNFSATIDSTHTVTGNFYGSSNSVPGSGDTLVIESGVSVFVNNVPFQHNGSLVFGSYNFFLDQIDYGFGIVNPNGQSNNIYIYDTTNTSFSDYTGNFLISLSQNTFRPDIPQTTQLGFNSNVYDGTAQHLIPGNWTVVPATVPVPSAVWLFGSAIAGLVGCNRRKTIQQ